MTKIILILCCFLPGSALAQGVNVEAIKSIESSLTGESVNLLDYVVKQSKGACVQDTENKAVCTHRIDLLDVRNINFDGNKGVIEFVDPESGGGGLRFIDAKNVKVSNVVIRWQFASLSGRDKLEKIKPIFSFGHVSPCEQGGILHMPGSFNESFQVEAVSSWDKATGWPWKSSEHRSADVYFPRKNTIDFAQSNSKCLPELRVAANSDVIVRHYVSSNFALHCVNCDKIVVDGVIVETTPGMAIVFDGGANIIIRNSIVRSRCLEGCVTAEPSVMADACHIAGSSGNILIENNDFGWQGDDGINVAGLTMSASLMGRPEKSMSKLMISGRASERVSLIHAGSQLAVYSPSLEKLVDTTVSSIERESKQIVVNKEIGLGSVILAPIDLVPQNVVIRKNYLHDNRARGILFTGSNAIISNNKIERVTMNAILMASDMKGSFEGPGATDVDISSNTIADVNVMSDRQLFPSPISIGAEFDHGVSSSGIVFDRIKMHDNRISVQGIDKVNGVSFGLGAKTLSNECAKKVDGGCY